MHAHRLKRLALLTQGAALVGFGISELACDQSSPPVDDVKKEDIHINAPPDPAPSGA